MDIMNVLPTYTTLGSQVTLCKILQVFFFNYEENKVRANLESLFLQYGLMWMNSESVDMRWHSIQLLIKMFEKKKNRKVIGIQMKNTMDLDNALIKSQIVHKVNKLHELNKKLGNYISEKAQSDNNFVIRKILMKRQREQEYYE